jgi:hypothetical protein
MPLYKLYSTSPARPSDLRARVTSYGAVTLASPGATIDGVTMANGEEFLAVNQSPSTQDGLYVFNGASVPATRSNALPVGAQARGIQVVVEEGSSADKVFICTSNAGADVVGTHDLVFREPLMPSRKVLQYGLANVAPGDNASPPSATAVQLGWGGTSGIAHGWVALRPGFISGLSVGLSTAAAGSGLIAAVYKNGTLVEGSEVTLTDVARNQIAYSDFALSFMSGDVLDVRIKTGSGWSATTADLTAGLEVTY